MKKALVNPLITTFEYIASWTTDTPPEAVGATIENINEIAEVVNDGDEFEVASPLFWVDIDDSLADKKIYYDPADTTVKEQDDVEQPD